MHNITDEQLNLTMDELRAMAPDALLALGKKVGQNMQELWRLNAKIIQVGRDRYPANEDYGNWLRSVYGDSITTDWARTQAETYEKFNDTPLDKLPPSTLRMLLKHVTRDDTMAAVTEEVHKNEGYMSRRSLVKFIADHTKEEMDSKKAKVTDYVDGLGVPEEARPVAKQVGNTLEDQTPQRETKAAIRPPSDEEYAKARASVMNARRQVDKSTEEGKELEAAYSLVVKDMDKANAREKNRAAEAVVKAQLKEAEDKAQLEEAA